jgi:hypothetical protein
MKRRMPLVVWILWAVSGGCLLILSGCYSLRASSGDGQVSFQPPRPIQAADIAVPAGYYIEPVATGLTFPAGVAFDDMGQGLCRRGRLLVWRSLGHTAPAPRCP